jgi:NAD dependent epimerase/dehydratase
MDKPGMNWTDKRILVTGAGGFIGSHLCERLLQLGAQVTALVRYTSRSDWGNLEYLSPAMKSSLKVVCGNIEDSNLVDSCVKGKDIVFHLAALIGIPYSYVAPLSYVRTNIEGTLNILEAGRKYSVGRILHTSTSETYGTALYTPIDEKHPLQGQSPYSASKISADKLAESYFLSFDLPVVTVRPFNTYGPRQSARAVIPTIISQALTRPEIMLGSLDPVRDLLFVKDTVNGFIRAAEIDGAIGETINIGFGEGITVGELANLVLRLMHLDKPVVLAHERVRPQNSEVFTLICDNRKALELIGWAPQYSLKEGLLEVVGFISENLHVYKPNIYMV